MTTSKKNKAYPLLDSEFAVFILTHGRPGNVITYDTLRKSGYTGPIFLIVDDLDKTRKEYEKRFPKEVVVFDKKASARTFDGVDNFPDMRAIIYARNASFEIAKKLGVKYFIQLDDDYKWFQYRFDGEKKYHPKDVKSLDRVFAALLRFYKSTPVSSIALCQGGDFIGGTGSAMAEKVFLKRKCMNSFLCSTERPFKFIGRINEDVNTYTRLASTGALFFTTNQVSLEQPQTQTNPGGMTDLYLDSGTYVKSFYSVMFHPSSVKIRTMNTKNARLHHSVAWVNTTPMILRETLRKKSTL